MTQLASVVGRKKDDGPSVMAVSSHCLQPSATVLATGDGQPSTAERLGGNTQTRSAKQRCICVSTPRACQHCEGTADVLSVSQEVYLGKGRGRPLLHSRKIHVCISCLLMATMGKPEPKFVALLMAQLRDVTKRAVDNFNGESNG